MVGGPSSAMIEVIWEPQNLKGGLTVAARLREFAALSLEFEEPHPLGVFDNFPKGDPPQ